MGDAADHLAKVVLEHAIMTNFCDIPLVSLREKSITELDLEHKGVGVPGAIVLSKLLPSAAALTSLKYASRPKAFAFVSAPADTAHHLPLDPGPAVSVATASDPREERRSPRASKAIRPCSRSSRLLGHSNHLPSVCLCVSAP